MEMTIAATVFMMRFGADANLRMMEKTARSDVEVEAMVMVEGRPKKRRMAPQASSVSSCVTDERDEDDDEDDEEEEGCIARLKASIMMAAPKLAT